MKASAAAAIQKHPYSPKLDNDRTIASIIQQTGITLELICQFQSRDISLKQQQQMQQER